jgi:hypothetical protein
MRPSVVLSTNGSFTQGENKIKQMCFREQEKNCSEKVTD